MCLEIWITLCEYVRTNVQHAERNENSVLNSTHISMLLLLEDPSNNLLSSSSLVRDPFPMISETSEILQRERSCSLFPSTYTFPFLSLPLFLFFPFCPSRALSLSLSQLFPVLPRTYCTLFLFLESSNIKSQCHTDEKMRQHLYRDSGKYFVTNNSKFWPMDKKFI